MSTKHTPGPWINTPSGPTMSEAYSQSFAIAQKGEANLVAGCFADVRGGIEVAEANARLIAAAPELLAAALRVQSFMDDYVKEGYESAMRRELRAAIAKATNETL